MQFMLLCCFDESRWNALPESERDRVMHAYGEWVQAQVAKGVYLSGGKLAASGTAVTVRAPGGKPRMTDGPFTESREQVGGFHIIECADRDAALAIAQTVPTLPAGGAIEVRELLYPLGS